MKNIKIHILLLISIMALMVSSCHYRELDYGSPDPKTATVKLVFDWSDTEMESSSINGRTVAIYPVNGDSPIIKISHSDTIRVTLPIGEYRVSCMNETFTDFDDIYFEGTDAFETIAAVLKKEESLRTGLDSKISYEPDMFAVKNFVPFTVTEEMAKNSAVAYTKAEQVDAMTVIVKPQPVVYKVKVVARVKGINNITSAGTYITGFADNFRICDNAPGPEIATHMMTFTERKFDDGSTTEGTLTGSFMSFGYHRSSTGKLEGYKMSFRAALTNGKIFEETRVINGQIKDYIVDGVLQISIDLGGDTTGENVPFDIPDVPGGDESEGWQVKVNEWQTEVIPVEF